jgi:hypothetical protein
MDSTRPRTICTKDVQGIWVVRNKRLPGTQARMQRKGRQENKEGGRERGEEVNSEGEKKS